MYIQHDVIVYVCMRLPYTSTFCVGSSAKHPIYLHFLITLLQLQLILC